ncbi:MAG: hypothetical protein ACKVJG_19715 [Candidatus Latescibacterota bacterium]
MQELGPPRFARAIRAYAIPIDFADGRLLSVAQLLWPLFARPGVCIELLLYVLCRLWGGAAPCSLWRRVCCGCSGCV